MDNDMLIDIAVPEDILFELLPFVAQALMREGRGDFIEKIYQQEKTSCILSCEEYRKSHTKCSLIEEGTLKREIELKHCLGVLLLANENDIVKRRLLAGMKIKYSSLYDFTRKKSSKLVDYLFGFVKRGETKEFYDLLYIAFYLLWLENGWCFSASPKYKTILNALTDQVQAMRQFQTDNLQQRHKFWSEKDEAYSILERFSAILGPSDIRRYKDEYDGLIRPARNAPLEPKLKQAVCDMHTIVAGILDAQILSVSLLLEPQSVFKDERKQICGFIHHSKLEQKLQNDEADRDAYLYILGLYITAFCKEYKNAKQFLQSDYSEIADELEAAYQKAEDLQVKNDALQQRIAVLEAQVSNQHEDKEKSRRKVSAEFYDQVATLKAENDRLTRENQSLSAAHYDYSRLRELAYSLENEEEIKDEQIDTTPILTEKKVFLIGGHENWHKRLKEAIPEINVLSGTAHSVNLEPLKNADHVLIFTGHMAHTVYDKLSAYLYKHEIPYSYLPCQNIDGIKLHIKKAIQK